MKKGIFILKWAVLGVAIFIFIGWLTMALWNCLIPPLFNGPVISFWQAVGLLVLSKILFSGIGGKRHSSYGSYWKHRHYNTWASMTSEEREALKSRMKEKWCRKYPEESTNQN